MQKRLGKGLEALIPKKIDTSPGLRVPVEKLRPSPYQPRENLTPSKLEELVQSIKNKGVIQPLIVRKRGEEYEVIAGHRRLEAAKRLNIKDLPVIVKELTDSEALEIGIIENLHREDLNPLEEALAYKRLSEEFNYSLQEIAQVTGKDKSTISNIMRLLKLPPIIQQALRERKISEGHARTLLSIEDPKKQMFIFERLLRERLSVRLLEDLAQKQRSTFAQKRSLRKNPQVLALEDEIQKFLKTKVRLTFSKRKYKLTLEFLSLEEVKDFLDRTKKAYEI